ncbi:MAG: hypothetical protein HC892_11570 [Saprospiraceae bacterium]|nr:hypothetical protein [Saprospiraceae bacterium]
MHDIEPYYHWRDWYIASEDERSPFFGRQYSEFEYTNKIYNYYIHPQWDDFGSNTLYIKLLFADYDEGFAILELIGEWNDCISNDVMYLKREVADNMIEQGIFKFLIICEHVLNFHGSDDCYYEEWFDDVKDDNGWICFVNTLKHVEEEMHDTSIHFYVNFGAAFNELHWRPQKPHLFYKFIDAKINGVGKRLTN